MRHRHTAILFCILLIPSFLGADVTLRYKTEIKPNPSLPPMLTQALGAMRSVMAPTESVLQRKGTRSYGNSGIFGQIADSSKNEVTVLDSVGKRFATIPASQYVEELSREIPQVPAAAQGLMASMKASVESRLTGRTAEIQGTQAEEHEIVISLNGAMVPGLPSGPMMRIVMQMWIAKPEEISHNPALREFVDSSISIPGDMNPAESIRKMLSQFPGMGDALGSLMKETDALHSVTLRIHTEVFMPMIATLTKMMAAGANNPQGGLDPSAAFMTMDQELVEMSAAPVADSVFQVPQGYTAAPLADIMSSMRAGLLGQAPPSQASPR